MLLYVSSSFPRHPQNPLLYPPFSHPMHPREEKLSISNHANHIILLTTILTTETGLHLPSGPQRQKPIRLQHRSTPDQSRRAACLTFFILHSTSDV